MPLDPQTVTYVGAGAGVLVALLVYAAFSGDKGADIERRMVRVGPQGGVRKIRTTDRRQNAVRESRDSHIPVLDYLVKFMPNPDKLRGRLGRTGRNIALGEYLLMNVLSVAVVFMICHLFSLSVLLQILVTVMLGLGIPHFVTGFMGNARLKKFGGNFPEAIDTMCRGLRSGLPVTESIGAVGREMPDPVGIEFRRIADGVRMGKSLEQSMWEVTRRIDTAEFRFLIIAMAIQKETGGNLAETLGNLADLIRRRRQLRMKIKAMLAEAKASAMIIGSLPFIMFILLMLVNPDYMMTMFHVTKGKVMIGGALFWMGLGWVTMTKMISFEI